MSQTLEGFGRSGNFSLLDGVPPELEIQFYISGMRRSVRELPSLDHPIIGDGETLLRYKLDQYDAPLVNGDLSTGFSIGQIRWIIDPLLHTMADVDAIEIAEEFRLAPVNALQRLFHDALDFYTSIELALGAFPEESNLLHPKWTQYMNTLGKDLFGDQWRFMKTAGKYMLDFDSK